MALEAMTLPNESRARLVKSLDQDDIGPLEQAWIAEAKRRRDDVRAGRVEAIPGEEALRDVRDSIRRCSREPGYWRDRLEKP